VVTVKIYNPDLDRLGATHFLTLCGPCLGHDPYFGNHCYNLLYTLPSVTSVQRSERCIGGKSMANFRYLARIPFAKNLRGPQSR